MWSETASEPTAPDGAGADGSLDHIIYGHYALTIT